MYSLGPAREARGEFFRTDTWGCPCGGKLPSPPVSLVRAETGGTYTDREDMGLVPVDTPRQTRDNNTDVRYISATESDDNHRLPYMEQGHTPISKDSIQNNVSTCPMRPMNGVHRHEEV